MAKKKTPTKESAAAVLVRVTKEMAQPRFAKSARKEEVATIMPGQMQPAT